MVPTAARLAGNEAGVTHRKSIIRSLPARPRRTRAASSATGIPRQRDSRRPDQSQDWWTYAKFVFPAAGPCFGHSTANGAYPDNATRPDTVDCRVRTSSMSVETRPLGRKTQHGSAIALSTATRDLIGDASARPERGIPSRPATGEAATSTCSAQRRLLQGQFSHTTVWTTQTNFFTAVDIGYHLRRWILRRFYQWVCRLTMGVTCARKSRH